VFISQNGKQHKSDIISALLVPYVLSPMHSIKFIHWLCRSLPFTGLPIAPPECRHTFTSGIVAAWPRTTSPEGATLAARRVQNPVQAGTGDVHNPHTPLSRLPHRFCAGMQQWSGTDSSPLGVQQQLHCSTDKNKTWRQSLLWPAQLYETVSAAVCEADSLHLFRRKLKTHLFTLF